MVVLFYGIALFSCLIGTICGMGGGVIIKPVLGVPAYAGGYGQFPFRGDGGGDDPMECGSNSDKGGVHH